MLLHCLTSVRVHSIPDVKIFTAFYVAILEGQLISFLIIFYGPPCFMSESYNNRVSVVCEYIEKFGILRLSTTNYMCMYSI